MLLKRQKKKKDFRISPTETEFSIGPHLRGLSRRLPRRQLFDTLIL